MPFFNPRAQSGTANNRSLSPPSETTPSHPRNKNVGLTTDLDGRLELQQDRLSNKDFSSLCAEILDLVLLQLNCLARSITSDCDVVLARCNKATRHGPGPTQAPQQYGQRDVRGEHGGVSTMYDSPSSSRSMIESRSISVDASAMMKGRSCGGARKRERGCNQVLVVRDWIFISHHHQFGERSGSGTRSMSMMDIPSDM